jgi:hypothetical protein
MPAVYPPAKVLVSGANGFVGIWVVRNLLRRGYSVRGTVRSLEKGDYLKQKFERYEDRLEIIVVEDVTQVRFCRFYVRLMSFNAFRGRKERLMKPSKMLKQFSMSLPLSTQCSPMILKVTLYLVQVVLHSLRIRLDRIN